MHFEEIDQRGWLKLWLLTLLLFLHGHKFFIEQHEVSVDGIFGFEIIQILIMLVFLFIFFLIFVFLIRLLILSFLGEGSGRFDELGVELIESVLWDVLFNVGGAFLQTVNTLNDAADNFNDQDVQLKAFSVRFLLFIEFNFWG